jgi:DNA invertase Pin-like site-specific DNA recombinase
MTVEGYERLAQAAARLLRAARAREEAAGAMDAAVRDAAAAGMPERRIADLAGISRGTVRRIISE